MYSQILRNMTEHRIPEDLLMLQDEHGEAFTVYNQELSATNAVEMQIDTGDHPPIKMKARPVPLGLRKKLGDMSKDL